MTSLIQRWISAWAGVAGSATNANVSPSDTVSLPDLPLTPLPPALEMRQRIARSFRENATSTTWNRKLGSFTIYIYIYYICTLMWEICHPLLVICLSKAEGIPLMVGYPHHILTYFDHGWLQSMAIPGSDWLEVPTINIRHLFKDPEDLPLIQPNLNWMNLLGSGCNRWNS